MYHHDLIREIEKQDTLHPSGYPYTRDGIRLGIAAIEDETREAWDAWHAIRRTIGNGSADPGDLRGELMQVAAICMRIVRTIDEAGSGEGWRMTDLELADEDETTYRQRHDTEPRD